MGRIEDRGYWVRPLFTHCFLLPVYGEEKDIRGEITPSFPTTTLHYLGLGNCHPRHLKFHIVEHFWGFCLCGFNSSEVPLILLLQGWASLSKLGCLSLASESPLAQTLPIKFHWSSWSVCSSLHPQQAKGCCSSSQPCPAHTPPYHRGSYSLVRGTTNNSHWIDRPAAPHHSEISCTSLDTEA